MRYFAFGCSYVNYKWASLPDLLGCNFDVYYNYGKGGMSNRESFYKLLTAHYDHKFNPETDYITFGVTGVARETMVMETSDTYTILYAGDVFPNINSGHYQIAQNYGKYIENWSYALYRSVQSIKLAKKFLDDIGVKYIIYRSVWDDPSYFNNHQGRKTLSVELDKLLTINESIDEYWATIAHPSAIEFNDGSRDGHPTPSIYYGFLKKYFHEYNTLETKNFFNLCKDIDIRSPQHQEDTYKKIKEQYDFYLYPKV